MKNSIWTAKILLSLLIFQSIFLWQCVESFYDNLISHKKQDISRIFTGITSIFLKRNDVNQSSRMMRPTGSDFDTPNAIVGKEKQNNCFQVLAQTQKIIKQIDNLLATLCDKFEFTDELIEENFVETFSKLDFICDKIETLTESSAIIGAALCSPIIIRQSDIGATTFTISAPGYYVLAENIVFSPASGQPAIEISSDDVILDMCGKILSQGNATSGVNAISIPGNAAGAPRTNVKIINGAIRDFLRGGIVVGTNSVIPANTAAQAIEINNIKIMGCDMRAIEFVGSIGALIENSKIIDCSISSCCTDAAADFAVYLFNTQSIHMKNCSLDSNGSSSVDLVGVHIQTSIKCFADNVSVLDSLAQTFTAFAINGSQDCVLTNCLASTNNSTNALIGFVVTGGSIVSGNKLTECVASNNSSVNGPFVGFELLSLINRNILANCKATNNTTTGAVASAHCYGFDLDQPTFCCLFDCQATNNQATGDGTTNRCAGFNISTSAGTGTGTKNCDFYRNFAFKNNAFNETRSFGFRAFSGSSGNTNNAYTQNVAIRNGPTSPISANQIVANGGAGSNPGGVPLGSIRSSSISMLNADQIEYSNIRII